MFKSYSIKELSSLLIAALFLMIPALYNGFPIVTSDSGAYIANAFTLQVPLDRPLGYSVFIRLASLGYTLWGVIACQSLMLAFLVQLLCKAYLQAHYHRGFFLATAGLLTIGSSCAWFNSQLMPDTFTAILLLALLVWYTVPISKIQRLLLACFIFCVLLAHNAHALTVLLPVPVALLFAWKRHRPWLRSTIMLALLSVGALITLSAMNAASGKGFRPSAASGVFLMCRMIENGTMDQFLAENCDHNQYNLCPYKDSLPTHQWEFMWNASSPLYKTGGWEANEKNYQAIERNILTTPRYLVPFLFKSGEATLRQAVQMHIGDGNYPLGRESSPYNNIKAYYPNELREYEIALQTEDRLPLNFLNGIILTATFILGIATLLAAAFSGGMSARWKRALGITSLFLLSNAAVTATFATVLARYQARVFWVLPFLMILYLLHTALEWARSEKRRVC